MKKEIAIKGIDMGKIGYWVVTMDCYMLVEAEDEAQAGNAAIIEALKHPDKFKTFIDFLKPKDEKDEDNNKKD